MEEWNKLDVVYIKLMIKSLEQTKKKAGPTRFYIESHIKTLEKVLILLGEGK